MFKFHENNSTKIRVDFNILFGHLPNCFSHNGVEICYISEIIQSLNSKRLKTVKT